MLHDNRHVHRSDGLGQDGHTFLRQMRIDHRCRTVADRIGEELVGVGCGRAIRHPTTGDIGVRIVLRKLDLTAAFGENFHRHGVLENLTLELVDSPRSQGEGLHLAHDN